MHTHLIRPVGPPYEYDTDLMKLERSIIKNSIDLFNVSMASYSPKILVNKDTLDNRIVQFSYTNKDRSVYDTTWILQNGDIKLTSNWNKERELAKCMATMINLKDSSTIWVFILGEPHLYEDRDFSAANYLLEDYGINPVTISLTTLVEMDPSIGKYRAYNQQLSKLKNPSILFDKEGRTLKYPIDSERFDYMVAFPPISLEPKSAPFGFEYGKEHTNSSSDTIVVFSYLRSEYNRLGLQALPIDSYLLCPGETVRTLIPMTHERVITKTVKLKS